MAANIEKTYRILHHIFTINYSFHFPCLPLGFDIDTAHDCNAIQQPTLKFWLKLIPPWSFHNIDICYTYLQSWWSWSCHPGCLSAARLGPSLCRGWSSASSRLLLQTGSCCGFPPCCRRPQRPCCWYSDSCWTSGSSGLWRQREEEVQTLRDLWRVSFRTEGNTVRVEEMWKEKQECVIHARFIPNKNCFLRNHWIINSIFIYQEQIWRCPTWPVTCWC